MSCKTSAEFEGGKVKISDYDSEVQPTWCSGCGNFAIWAAFKRALVELQLAPQDVLLCFDIGCNGNMSDKIRGYRLHSLHGRVLPLAAATKIANPKLKVIAFAGDGATYSEGINHFVNSVRNNFPITFFVHDNGNYGLTTGQASATTPQCAPRTANPDGPTATTLNPLDLAFALNPSFVARGFSGDIPHLTEVMKAAIEFQDKGFAYVDILQSCPTYNKETDHFWFQKRVRTLEGKPGDAFTSDLEAARKISAITDQEIHSGILYQNTSNPTYLQRLEYRSQTGSAWAGTSPVEEVAKQDISGLLGKFR